MSFFSKIVTRFLFVIFLFSLVLDLPVISQAKNQLATKTVVIIGTGRIHGKNPARAREKAIENGLASAVENAAVEILPPELLARNFKTFIEVLNGQTGKFIQSYRVLAEVPLENSYSVVLKANVFIGSLKNFLSNAGILLSEKLLPKILVLISEQKPNDRSPKYWWGRKADFDKAFSASALVSAMKNKGFSIINPRRIPKKTIIETIYGKPVLNDHEAANLGLKLQADVVIIGKSTSVRTPNTMGQNIRSFKGMISVRAIRADTGEEIAATMQSAVSTNTDETAGARNVLSNAGSLAGEALSSQIVYAWQKEETSYNTVEIIVERTDNLSNFEKFRRILTQMPGVKNLQMKEIKATEVTLTVEFQGNAKALADALMLKTFGSVGINIYEVSPDHLKIELVPG